MMIEETRSRMEFEPIAPTEPVAVRIAKQILERIREGNLPLGTGLPAEAELARQFQVSRPTIREALGALQFAGYLESGRGLRKRVIAVETDPSTLATASAVSLQTPASVIALLEARLVIEPQAVALAAISPVPEAIDRAETLVRGMRVAATDASLLAMTDLRVHRAIIEICPNALVVDSASRLLDMMSGPALHPSRERAWANVDLPRTWASHHEDVLRAIQERNPDAATLASRVHLLSVMDNVQAALGNPPTPQPSDDTSVLEGDATSGLSRLQLLAAWLGLATTDAAPLPEAQQ
jgi:DNA-binding FadR family transcriptional regulator